MTRTNRAVHTPLYLTALCVAALLTGLVWADGNRLLNVQPEILARADAKDRDGFGSAVALGDDIAAVGAAGADGPTQDAGAVSLYEHSENTWRKHAVLRLENVGVNTRFGTALDLENGWLAAGASGIYSDLGAVYLYRENDGEWQEQTRLTPTENQDFVFFGSTLDMDADSLAVGAPGYDGDSEDSGLVMTYRLTDAGTWTDGSPLSPDSPVAGERFGTDVALDGNRLLVGAAGAQGIEAAYLFEYREGAWQQTARLSEDPGAGYGEAVALQGDTALVAARRAVGDSGEPQGAVFAYALKNGAWTRQAVLRSDAPARRDQFGAALALDDDIALVAAPRDDGAAADAGAVFLFARSEGGWQLQGRLARTGAEAYDNFGGALALENYRAWVGTPGDVAPGSDARGTGTVTQYQP